MTREQAKLYIEERATELLQRDGSGKGYVCPICGSGSGRNGTGLTTRDGGKHFTCWAGGCFSSSDIFDIVGKQYGLTSFLDKLYKAAELLGIHIDGSPERLTQPSIHNSSYTTQITQHTAPEEEEDYTLFFQQAHSTIGNTSYHRGLSQDTLDRFQLGYEENWINPKGGCKLTTPRLIIPTGKHSYLARDTRSNLTDKQKKYSKLKVGKAQLYNVGRLQDSSQPVFIVEGELDALSIEDVGGSAVALGSTSNRGKLITLLKKQRPTQPLVLSLDNDEPGRKAHAELCRELGKLGITYYTADIAKPYKDANEALMLDREALTAAVSRIERMESETMKAEKEMLLRESAYYHLADFMDEIEQSKESSYVPTGFPGLDSLLDGGLYPGLYVVGAISSLGKTTFCLQVADQVAERGQDVLIFSLEMAARELIAKSVSRQSYILNRDRGGASSLPKTTRGILTGSRYAKYSREERTLIEDAVASYGLKSGEHIFITEGVGNVGIAEIREKVEKHIRLTGKAPAVLIDYLQILAPADPRATDKQNTDTAVLELKRMSRDFSIPVVGISSFNRENYTAPVNLSSFKESGAIEYSSDVLLALQYEGMDYREGETEAARLKRIRELQRSMTEKAGRGEAQPIQLKVLKNRNGSKGDCQLYFLPTFNYFTEEELTPEAGRDSWSRVN